MLEIGEVACRRELKENGVCGENRPTYAQLIYLIENWPLKKLLYKDFSNLLEYNFPTQVKTCTNKKKTQVITCTNHAISLKHSRNDLDKCV